ncbi:DUF805 domain-containing protein [Proteiniclasticum sp. SCR006]|uniref:DUF805 domain-containing protein n=1 Tax=Proteiniclasticum aestuarii TaxID=2817862 RepID=A0A939H8B3_9CLOT|nr:DUF805 domain-containing protein [Proteiniclasticum aestuarii]MBO1266177.1 DUF805 domain-containing protein [Proteiniclasticum aestuarii]
MKTNSNKIKALRLDKSWSQEQLSERSGLSLRTIQRIENGSNISAESLRLIAEALSADPSELILQKKQKPQTPVESIKKSFMEYANFSGKATRYEYWWFLLFMVLVLAIATIIHEQLNQIVAIIFLVPFLAVGSRRLNDIGRSVWWQLFLLVPFGQIVVLFMMAEKSEITSVALEE